MVRMLYLRDIDVDVHVRCCACGHSGILPRVMLERRFGPNYPVLSIAPHYRCSVCDSRDTESRPAPPDEVVPMPLSAVEEAPSFDGPLAALRGLLDAARGNRLDDDDDDREDGSAEDEDGDGAPLVPAFPPRFDRPAEPPARPDPPVAPPPFSLEDLVKDSGEEAEGRRPLWEPVSLAEIASRLDQPEGRGGAAWEEEPEEDPEDPPEIPRQSPPGSGIGQRKGEPAGNPDADETLFAMRQFLAQDDAEADTAEPALDFPANLEEDEEEEAPSAFTSRTLARADFEDDTADDGDSWDATLDDEDPSDEEILAFAIRDPERNDRREPPAELPSRRPLPRLLKEDPAEEDPPEEDWPREERPREVRPRDERPWDERPWDEPLKEERPERSVRGSDGRDFEDHDTSMEKTLAALRSMIEEAAAEPEPPAEPDRPGKTAPAMQMPDEEEEEDDPFPVRMSLKDMEPPEESAAPRRSGQEMEIEQAMRSLRDLMEADEPPTPMPPKPLTPKPPRPAFGRNDRRQDEDRPADNGFGLADPPEQALPAPPEETATEPTSRRRQGKGGEPSALDKTIAALRGMLELDGKRKK